MAQVTYNLPAITPQWPTAQFQRQVSAPLTAGMPDPASVERQKEEYLRALEGQREHFTAALDQQRHEYLDHLHNQALRQKREIDLAVDQQVKQQEMALTQEYNQQRLQLSHRIHQQRGTLEQKAIHLKAEYAQGKMQEELMAKQYELHMARQEAERQFAADMLRLQQFGLGQAAAPAAPPGYATCTVHQPAPSCAKAYTSYTPPPVSALEATASYAPTPHVSPSYTPPPVGMAPLARPCGYGGA